MADEKILNEKELDAAEAAAVNAPGVYTLTLKKPVTWEDITADKLVFDFDSLTGADSLAVEEELALYNKPLVVREFNGDYLIRLACRACTTKVSVGFLLALPIREANRLIGAMRSFLIRTESGPETADSGSENRP